MSLLNTLDFNKFNHLILYYKIVRLYPKENHCQVPKYPILLGSRMRKNIILVQPVTTSQYGML